MLAVLSNEVVRVMVFFYLSPLWTILLGRWVLNEHLTGVSKVALSVSLLGAVVMLWNESMLSTPIGKGDALALSAGMAFALTNVMTRPNGISQQSIYPNSRCCSIFVGRQD